VDHIRSRFGNHAIYYGRVPSSRFQVQS
jgi:hypothetical protein